MIETDTIEIRGAEFGTADSEVEIQDTIELSSAVQNAVEPTENVAVEEKATVELPLNIDENTNELLQILNAQNDILDCMLTQQKKIHTNVRERQWLELESNINNMRAYSDAFVNLDECRENFVGENKDLYLSPEVEPVFVSVRTKLSKSKIENSALAVYVQSTQEFVDGVLQNCVPQKRNTLYNNRGKIVKPAAESVVVDTLF